MSVVGTRARRSAKVREPKQYNIWAAIIGAIITIVLFVVGFRLLHERSWILKLPSQWLALAILPLLLGLVIGRYLGKISFGLVGLEAPGAGYKYGLEPAQQERPPRQEQAAVQKTTAMGRFRRFLSPRRKRPELQRRPPWAKLPKGEGAQTHQYLTLVHTYKPSKQSDQKYDVSVYLMRHIPGPEGNRTIGFTDIDHAEFFFGRNWGNRIFHAPNDGEIIGVNTSAWGMFLATCRVIFKDGSEPLVLYRYIDFEMGSL